MIAITENADPNTPVHDFPEHEIEEAVSARYRLWDIFGWPEGHPYAPSGRPCTYSRGREVRSAAGLGIGRARAKAEGGDSYRKQALKKVADDWSERKGITIKPSLVETAVGRFNAMNKRITDERIESQSAEDGEG